MINFIIGLVKSEFLKVNRPGNKSSSIQEHLKHPQHNGGIESFRIIYNSDPALGKFEIVEAQLVNDLKPSICAQKILGRKLGFVGTPMHPNVQFTMEEEIDGTMNFLDVSITRQNDSFFTRNPRYIFTSDIFPA